MEDRLRKEIPVCREISEDAIAGIQARNDGGLTRTVGKVKRGAFTGLTQEELINQLNAGESRVI